MPPTRNFPTRNAKPWGNRQDATSVKLAFIRGRIGSLLVCGALGEGSRCRRGGWGKPMRFWSAMAGLLALAGAAAPTLAAECPGNPDALGTSRVITVDPAEHARIGAMQYHE